MPRGLPEPLQAARYWLARRRPYLAAALWALVPVETEACRCPISGQPTMASDRWWRLYYHPEVVGRYEVEDLGRILYHEIAHLLRDHATQTLALGADPTLANLAQDLAINQDLREDDGMHPSQGVFPDQFGLPRGLTWVEYYERLRPPAGNGAGKDPQRSGVPQERPGSVGDEPGRGLCGSAAHGQRMPWEAEGPDPSEGPEGSRMPEGRGAVDGELIRRAVAEAIRRAAPGTVPGAWVRWADEVGRVRVEWRRVLAAAVRHGIAQARMRADYTWQRPNRRQAVIRPAVLPGMTAPVPRITVVIDTSGSMGEADLGVAMAAVRDLLQVAAQGGAITVIPCDAAAGPAQRVFSAKSIRLVGGGGTNMGEGLARAVETQPDVIVVMTDGLTPWPDEAPPVPVAIALIGDADVETPAWARTVVRIQAKEGRG
ncbi:vWA domain-containing protein [Thermaerobacter litoralis]